MSAQRFVALARLVAGSPWWQRETAVLLRVSPRTIRRWASAERPVPLAVIRELERALGRHLPDDGAEP